jgi:regulator of replication initiation timing
VDFVVECVSEFSFLRLDSRDLRLALGRERVDDAEAQKSEVQQISKVDGA